MICNSTKANQRLSDICQLIESEQEKSSSEDDNGHDGQAQHVSKDEVKRCIFTVIAAWSNPCMFLFPETSCFLMTFFCHVHRCD